MGSIDKLTSDLLKMAKRLEKKDNNSEMTPLVLESDVREMLSILRDSISALINIVAVNTTATNAVSSLEKKVRKIEDNSEHHYQRSLRGKFFISFAKDNVLPTPQSLAEKNTNVIDYTRSIISKKYLVDINRDQMKTCHFTKKGIIFRLINLAAGSAYAFLVQAIKNGTGKENTSFYVNYCLTPQRSSLLFELRSYKKAKKLERYFTDDDGSISYVHNEGDPKKRCTSIRINSGSSFYLKTFNSLELRAIFSPDVTIDTTDDTRVGTLQDNGGSGRQFPGRPQTRSSSQV